MNLSTLGILVFGALTWVCWQSFGLRATHAVSAFLLGFFVADCGAAPTIRTWVGQVFDWVTTWNF
jgi:hypothetical protein